MMRARRILFLAALALLLAGCPLGIDPDHWAVSAEVSSSAIVITATIADAHGDFVHMSIRKKGWDNHYSVERSPAPDQPERDWSRVHHWFGALHPDTYLEGRIDDGSGRGPSQPQAFEFSLARAASGVRMDHDDQRGSDYRYITRGYSYADGNVFYPSFGPGEYEIEIYAWYTGYASIWHPASGGQPQVQYVHYDMPIVSTSFVID